MLGMPLCADIQIYLLRLLESWGMTQDTSHSSREVAAANAVGALSFRQAMTACYVRCSATGGVAVPKGAMLAVRLGVKGVKPHIKQVNSGQPNVACINSPSSVTVSGDVVAIDEIEAVTTQGTECVCSPSPCQHCLSLASDDPFF